MPQHALSTQPLGARIVLWRAPESEGIRGDLGRFFPAREVEGLSEARRREHGAVVEAVRTLLGHDQWQLEHDADGKPWLREADGTGGSEIGLGADEARRALSLSHCTVGDEVWVAAAMWDDDRATGGIDLVLTDDERFVRVAPRVMSLDERNRWAGREAWAWATKEAMFKGHGPALEFQRDTLLDEVTENESGTGGRLAGRVRGAAWRGGWSVEAGRLLVVWAE
jgi:hypothetical protein